MIKEFIDAKRKLLEHVGVTDNEKYLIELSLDDYWLVEEDQVTYAKDKKEIVDDTGNYYVLDNDAKFVGKNYTAVLTDHHNLILTVFDNKKEISIDEVCI